MRKSFLKTYSKLKLSNLEIIESIDMNRLIDYGYKIVSVLSNSNLVSIDVPNDKKTVIKLMKKNKIFNKYKKNYEFNY